MGTHPIFESDFDCLTEMVYRIDLSGLSPKATIHDLTRRFCALSSLKLAHWSPDVRLRVSYARKTNFIKCLKKMKKNKVGLTIVKQTPIPQKTKKTKKKKIIYTTKTPNSSLSSPRKRRKTGGSRPKTD